MTRVLRVAAAVTMFLTMILAVASPASATFPGKDGRIAFYANRDDHPATNLYVVSRSAHGVDRITDAAPASALHEDWSPDGTKIVFEIDPDANGGNAIEIMNADGSGVRNLTGKRDACEFEPSFTPNGHRIVFIRDMCGNPRSDQLWSMNVHGKNRRKILQVPAKGGALDPNVSPDGKAISFVAKKRRALLGGALFVVNTNGAGLHRIVPFSRDVGIKHDWAPDGSRIVFTEYLDYNQEGAKSGPHTPNVATVRPDGSGLRELTHLSGKTREAIAGSYSPNGRWIVFRFDNFDHYRLMKMRPGGGHKTLIERMRLKQRGMDWGARSS
jgi:Tol biopolymer transport system component